MLIFQIIASLLAAGAIGIIASRVNPNEEE